MKPRWKYLLAVFMLTAAFSLAGCEGDDGATGPAGPTGQQGDQGDPGTPGQDGEDGQDDEGSEHVPAEKISIDQVEIHQVIKGGQQDRNQDKGQDQGEQAQDYTFKKELPYQVLPF